VKGPVNGKEVSISKTPPGLVYRLTGRGKEKELTGKVCVQVRVNDRPVAVFILTERVREGVIEVVKALKNLGLKVVMLTEDKKANAEPLARKLGFDEFYAELKPGDKVQLIEKYRVDSRVAMVGDGINDALALGDGRPRSSSWRA